MSISILAVFLHQRVFLADVDDREEEYAHEVDGYHEYGGYEAAGPAGERYEGGDEELEGHDDYERSAFGKADEDEFVVEVELVGVEEAAPFPLAAPEGGEGVEDGDEQHGRRVGHGNGGKARAVGYEGKTGKHVAKELAAAVSHEDARARERQVKNEKTGH